MVRSKLLPLAIIAGGLMVVGFPFYSCGRDFIDPYCVGMDISTSGDVVAVCRASGRLDYHTTGLVPKGSRHACYGWFALRPDGKQAVIIGEDGYLYWTTVAPETDLGKTRLRRKASGYPRFSPDGSLVIVPTVQAEHVGTADIESSLVFYDAKSHAFLGEVSTQSLTTPPALGRDTVAFSPDGKWLLARQRVFEVSTRKLAGVLKGPFKKGYFGGMANQSAFSRDGRFVAFGDNNILLTFRTSDWTLVGQIAEGENVYYVGPATTPSGFTIVTESEIILLDPKKGKNVLKRGDDYFHSEVRLSGDGTTLAILPEYGTLNIKRRTRTE